MQTRRIITVFQSGQLMGQSMSGKRQERFQVDLRGLIDLLSQHLYSGPAVFVRELLQNGVDAILAASRLGALIWKIQIELIIDGWACDTPIPGRRHWADGRRDRWFPGYDWPIVKADRVVDRPEVPRAISRLRCSPASWSPMRSLSSRDRHVREIMSRSSGEGTQTARTPYADSISRSARELKCFCPNWRQAVSFDRGGS